MDDLRQGHAWYLKYTVPIRLSNLFIVALTMIYFRYAILFQRINDFTLSLFDFILLILATIMVTGSGNIINDIMDVDIDKINKPGKNPIGLLLTKRDAYKYYYLLVLAGGIISGYLAIKTSMFPWFLLYPGMVSFLWLYAKKLKMTGLPGNVLISIFSAGVGLLVFLSEYKSVFASSYKNEIINIFVLFAAFAFFISLSREIIKDIQDMKGDMKFGSKSLPATMGTWMANFVVISALFLLAFLVFFSMMSVDNLLSDIKSIYGFFVILIPIFYLSYKVYYAESKKDYREISLWLKLLMVGGIIYLGFF